MISYAKLGLQFVLVASTLEGAAAHGHLLKAVIRRNAGVAAEDQIACAANAPGSACSSTVKMRKLIPRSGNDGACAVPPGCELGCPGVTGSVPGGAPCANLGVCDHCALEKTSEEKPIVGGDGSKWWTRMPAAHWDEPDQWPIFPCMSRDTFGARGTVRIQPGDSISTTTYMNADHSGLYRFELACAANPTNADFNAGPITPWKALHPSKELAPGTTPLPAGRDVGSTRAETDAYWAQTVCTAASCPYRMNGAAPQYPGGAYDITSAACLAGPSASPPAGASAAPTCFIEDTFDLPLSTICRGEATLRWMWNSAEGLETYANCVDLIVEAATAAPPGGGSGATSGSGGGGSSGGGVDLANQTDDSTTSSSMAVAAAVLLVGVAVGVYWNQKRKTAAPPSQPTTAVAVSRVPPPPPSVAIVSTTAAPAPSNWTEMVDAASGRTYYYDTTTGASSWTLPAEKV